MQILTPTHYLSFLQLHVSFYTVRTENMGDHFVLLVDRLITESTIEAAIQSRNQMLQANIPVEECTILDDKTLEMLRNGDLSMAECRICHDEDLDSNMETPCSCSGSVKVNTIRNIFPKLREHWLDRMINVVGLTWQYAHRRCVQRWCNEKGDTTCEICHQVCLLSFFFFFFFGEEIPPTLNPALPPGRFTTGPTAICLLSFYCPSE